MGDAVECLESLAEVFPFNSRFRSHDRGLDLGVLVPGLPRLQIGAVDAEPFGDPGQRLRRRARLPALDLADVLLREPIAG